MTELEKKNIRRLLHDAAMVARGAVMAKEDTKESVFEYVAEVGNEEFEKLFAKSDTEICLMMLQEIVESDFGQGFIEEITK